MGPCSEYLILFAPMPCAWFGMAVVSRGGHAVLHQPGEEPRAMLVATLT
jgi:hypothetical protein